MSNPTINFITGLPRAGSTIVASLLQQNPSLHSAIDRALAPALINLHQTWPGDQDLEDKKNVMRHMVQGMYSRYNKSTVFSQNLEWAELMPILSAVFDQQARLLVCVRNPAEILASFEAERRSNALRFDPIDNVIDSELGSNIPSRCQWHAMPGQSMGLVHRKLQDLVVMGMLDRMLFVDYGLLCTNPQTQMRRIYDFFELPEFDHDFSHIPQTTPKIRSKLEKKFINPVTYIGLDLFDQYNKQIFWNAWI